MIVQDLFNESIKAVPVPGVTHSPTFYPRIYARAVRVIQHVAYIFKDVLREHFEVDRDLLGQRQLDLGERMLTTRVGDSDEPSHDEADEPQASAMQTDQAEPNAPSPFFKNWDAELGDIMLPAQFLQELDEGLLLPNWIHC